MYTAKAKGERVNTVRRNSASSANFILSLMCLLIRLLLQKLV